MPQNPAAMLQAFQGLMQDPVAMKAMMGAAQQMGIPPQMLQMGMQMAGGGGGAPMPQGGDPMMQAPGGGPAMPPDMGGAGPSGEGEQPPMSPEEMAQSEIDNAGATFDGVDAPTQNDIDRLMAEPTDAMVEAFDAQFGDGAAAQYLGQDGDGGEPSESPEETGPEAEAANESDEY